ncbi:hypothetical protein P175DRAFT_0553682 [Aspergillus ochraceoroseus IBT 24754]|uniref:SMP domain-containing protein n=1 Tax=Aspergillus ochraceoroseus IBT 24754 TaxID=1392256 RepID=A0A2T5M786_9EURO|nr:uncharacterized protein P175DRAFT_0553682 [Aspergillus ochraceoroseus IBT 24754]PTU24401.1 hypothetical protein P175DRAFT_0553682 [Aspergillus ochraceoroseus IBT 24754]
MPRHEMTKSDASRIQSSQAKGAGDMSSQGFAARAQAAGDHWASSSQHTSSSGGGSNESTGVSKDSSTSHYSGTGSGENKQRT